MGSSMFLTFCEVRELQRQDFPDLIIGHAGDAQPTGLRKRLQSSGDVHPITEHVSDADHYVTYMHSHAEIDVMALRKGRVGFRQGILSFHGAADRINGATELRQHTVASRVGYTATMRRNLPVEDFPARRKSVQGSDLIGSHEAAIALNVSRENSSQSALHFNGVCQG